MQSVLLDAGALAAILGRNDRHHADLTELLERFEGWLFTTWPVISKACALVSERAQVRVLDWIAEAGVEIVSIDAARRSISKVETVLTIDSK